MMTRPAPLSAPCDPDSSHPGALLPGLLAAVAQAFVAAFSWTTSPRPQPQDLPGTPSARARRMMRGGD